MNICNTNIDFTIEGKVKQPLTSAQFRTIADEIYLLRNGFLNLEKNLEGYHYDSPLANKIKNEFEEDQPADKMVQSICLCREHLKEKMEIIQGDDDDDILEMISIYDDLIRYLSYISLEYGYRLGLGEI